MVRTTYTYVLRQTTNRSFSNPEGIGTAYTHSAVSMKSLVYQLLATYVHKIICKAQTLDCKEATSHFVYQYGHTSQTKMH